MYSNNIIEFKANERKKVVKRKEGINKNRNGSVRKVNGRVYVDFPYLGIRVRESSGLSWNIENGKKVRKMLDKIIVQIESGEFVFADAFPYSKKKDFFTELEFAMLNRKLSPDQVLFNDYVWEWYNLRKESGENRGRTLYDYKGYIEKYLIPFFGDRTFGSFNPNIFNKFKAWARKQKYRKKPVGYESLKKYLVLLKMICKDAALEYGWKGTYDPFFGYKMPKSDKKPKDNIDPFSLDEQKLIIDSLPNHWKPYFEFAFASGISQGEQRAIKPENIDWNKKRIVIEKAMTLDIEGRRFEGNCKNEYRKRDFRLSPKMLSALKSHSG